MIDEAKGVPDEVFRGLNKEQQAAVSSKAVLKAVIAGPGSGKSRVAHAIAEQLLDENLEVVILTYTNSAAHVLRERLAKTSFTTTLIYLGTLHSYCLRLIQRFGHHLGFHGRVGILPEDEKLPRLRAVADKLGRKSLSLSDIKARVGPDAAMVWKEYEFQLRQSHMVDYDGILEHALILLAFPEVLEAIQFDALVVDEGQDSARIDWGIYGALPATYKTFTGDPDQSIFQFRGAEPALLVECALSATTTLFRLENNYRSDIAICECANKLISHNQNRVPKEIVSMSKDTGAVIAQGFADPWQELQWMGGMVSGYLERKRSIAVLARTNFEAARAYNFLQGSTGLLLRRNFGQIMPDDWKRAVTLIGLCVTPDNDILAERMLRLEGETDEEIANLRLKVEARGENLCSLMGRGSLRLVDLSNLRGFLPMRKISALTVSMIDARIKLLAPDALMPDLLEDLLAHEGWQEPEPEAVNQIHVGTIHGAKGREFDVVFLPAFEEGVIPPGRKGLRDLGGAGTRGDAEVDYFQHKELALEEIKMEEERRLAFVGLTRARHQVHITHAEVRQHQWGQSTSQQPSRFIKEMGL